MAKEVEDKDGGSSCGRCRVRGGSSRSSPLLKDTGCEASEVGEEAQSRS